ncbi:hypothetical protein [Methanolobus psychrotolerans]|uniref:hypothetical protein n=1 Tax=Methanolobus psychrotolerans TaxID=1874706 RepID=UPI00101AEAC9|nr:hypothetical protein [Methanolobus psychrotolerans]
MAPATCVENIYQELASEEVLSLSSHYHENSTFPLQSFYNKSNEYKYDHPFYAYNLALKCRRMVMKTTMNDIVSAKGTELFISDSSKDIIDEDDGLENELAIVKEGDLTFQSIEWLSLAERDYQESKQYYSIFQNDSNNSNVNTTLDALLKTDFAIYKTRNLLNVVEERNKLSPSINYAQLSRGGEEVASERIKMADESLSTLRELGEREDVVKYCEDHLDIAKEYYSQENYYMATMTAAEVKALIDFGMTNEKFDTSQGAIIYAQNQFKSANSSLESLRNNNNVDAPIAILHLETAEIRIEEAKNAEPINSVPLADSAIRNSLIAKEQGYAILEYKEAIESIDKTPEETNAQSLPVGISSFFVVLLTYVALRRKGT